MSAKKTVDINIKTNADEAAKEFDTLATGVKKAADSAENLDAKFEDVFKGVEPLTTRLGEAEDRLYELALAGDTTSKEYQELLTKVGQYRKVQIQTDLAVDAAATTLGQKLGGALTGATSGFAAVQGVMGLVGSESEELEKALLKVQSALAIQQGVQGIRESIPAFKQLGQTAMTALKGIKTGIAATGIGVFVVAIGTLVAYWDDIKEAISGVTDEQKALTAESQKNVDAAQENLAALDLQENSLRLQGKSEREILQIKIKKTEAVEDEIKANIENDKIVTEAQVAQLTRSQEMAESIARLALQMSTALIRVLTVPLDLLLDTANSVSEFLGFGELTTISLTDELDNLIDRGAEAVSTFLFDPEEAQAESNARIREQENTLAQLKSNREGFQLQIQAIDRAEVESNRAKNEQIQKDNDDAFDKMVEEEKALQEIFDQIKRENEDRLRTDQENELLLVEEKYDRLQAMAQGNAEALNEIEIARLNERNDINLKYQKDEEKTLTEREEFAALSEDRKRDLAVGAATDTFSTLSNLAELFAGESKKQQKKAFKVQKAANIAQATVDTFSSAIAAYKSQASIPVVGPVLGGIAAAAAVSAGLLNIKKISQQRFDSGGGTDGGGADFAPSGGGAQAPSFNVVGDSGVNQLAQLQQQPTQAFVVSGEVTTAQALDRNRIQNATL